MSKKIPLIGPDPLTPEWFDYRSKIIGSSEAAKACGMSEYGTPLSLYLEKTGQIEPFQGNEHTRRGRRYEPLIAEDWQDLTGRKLRRYPCPMFLHPDHHGIAATPDGEIDDDEGLEIKSTTFRMRKKLGDEETDDIPQDWIFQAQQQMAVMGWRVVHFCILVDLEPCVYRVDRNDDMIDLMVSAELELLERIRDRCPPEPNFEHASTPQLIRAMHKVENGRRIMLSEKSVLARREYEELAETIKAAEKRQEQCRSVYEHEIGDNFAGVLPDGFMVRRKFMPKGRREFDVDARWDYRKVKFDGGPITSADELEAIQEQEARWHRTGQLLESAGATLSGRSDETESMYWRLPDGTDVRVSAHPANAATREWMESVSAREIRLDLVEDVGAAVAALSA